MTVLPSKQAHDVLEYIAQIPGVREVKLKPEIIDFRGRDITVIFKGGRHERRIDVTLEESRHPREFADSLRSEDYLGYLTADDKVLAIMKQKKPSRKPYFCNDLADALSPSYAAR